MRIGLLYTLLRKEEKLIIKELKSRGIYVVKIDDKISKIRLGENEFKKLDFVLIRSMSLTHALFWSRFFESVGIKTINSYNTLNICGNKYLTNLKLTENNIPAPKGAITFDSDSALEIMEEFGFPCVLKPVVGSWGSLISKINDKESAQAILEHKQFLNSPYKNVYYIQEFINKPGRDIRTLVVGENVMGAIYRASDNWKTNTTLNALPLKCPLTKEIEELSLKAAKAVEGDIVSVDIFESGKKLLVNEVNGVAEFRRSLEAYNVDIPKKIADYVTKKVIA